MQALTASSNQSIKAAAPRTPDQSERPGEMLPFGKLKFIRKQLCLPDFCKGRVPFIVRKRDVEPRFFVFPLTLPFSATTIVNDNDENRLHHSPGIARPQD